MSDADSPIGAVPDPGRSVRSVVGRAALIVMAASVVARLIAVARDVVVADIWGADQTTDAFFLAYKIPYLLTSIVAGALTAALVPLASNRLATGRAKEAQKLFVNMGNAAGLAMIALSVLLIGLARWIVPLAGFGFTPEVADKAVFLFRILMTGFVFAGLTGLISGMLNSLHKFALAAFAPAVGTAVTLVIIATLGTRLGLTALAIGTVAAWMVGLAVVLVGLRGQKMEYRFEVATRDPAMREAMAMAWPVLLGSAVGSIGVFANQVMGSTLEAASVSSLNYAEKMFQLCLGLFVSGISVPIFPLLSEQVASGAPKKVRATVNFALRLMGFVMVPLTVGIVLLRYPIVGLVFEHGKFAFDDTSRTAWTLLFMCLGLYSYAGRDTLTRVFYAYHDTRTPVRVGVVTVVVSIGFSYWLMQYMGVGGLALGYSVAVTVNYLVLAYFLWRKHRPLGFGETLRSMIRVLGAAAVMGVAIWGVDTGLAHVLAAATLGYAVRVVVGLVVGVGVFFLTARLMKSPEMAETRDMLRAVFKRS
jgi:putative peptidoglycan lipid II flippase